MNNKSPKKPHVITDNNEMQSEAENLRALLQEILSQDVTNVEEYKNLKDKLDKKTHTPDSYDTET